MTRTVVVAALASLSVMATGSLASQAIPHDLGAPGGGFVPFAWVVGVAVSLPRQNAGSSNVFKKPVLDAPRWSLSG